MKAIPLTDKAFKHENDLRLLEVKEYRAKEVLRHLTETERDKILLNNDEILTILRRHYIDTMHHFADLLLRYAKEDGVDSYSDFKYLINNTMKWEDTNVHKT